LDAENEILGGKVGNVAVKAGIATFRVTNFKLNILYLLPHLKFYMHHSHTTTFILQVQGYLGWNFLYLYKLYITQTFNTKH